MNGMMERTHLHLPGHVHAGLQLGRDVLGHAEPAVAGLIRPIL